MISVILPTYNRFEIVHETIQKTLNINTDIEFEIIVVNDGETLPFTIEHPKLHIYKNPKRGAASARNFGAEKAKYAILFFIDDDMWITEESLVAIQKMEAEDFFKSNTAVLNWQYPDSLVDEMQKNKIGRYLLKANYHTLEGRLKKNIDHTQPLIKINSMGSGSFAIAKDVFTKIGCYNENFIFQGEDIDLSNRLNSTNTGIYLYTQVTCYHNQKDRLDIKEFIDRDYRGYLSQFKRIDKTQAAMPSNSIKQVIFSALIPFVSIFLFLFNNIPNKNAFDVITFRIIGILSSISYFKAKKDAGK
jgi:glycosyltransferase involved in cell wall biosynthesis